MVLRESPMKEIVCILFLAAVPTLIATNTIKGEASSACNRVANANGAAYTPTEFCQEVEDEAMSEVWSLITIWGLSSFALYLFWSALKYKDWQT